MLRPLSAVEGRCLVELARRAIHARLGGKAEVGQEESAGPLPALDEARAVFVTVEVPEGVLRGCMGTLEHPRPLREEVPRLAVQAATLDHRFPPVRPEELSQVALKVSILTPPVLLESRSPQELLEVLEADRPGVVITLLPGLRRAVFLPEVWESCGGEAAAFLGALCIKAGAPKEFWRESFGRMKAERFRTQIFTG